jgi:hypothetical protein
MPIGEIDWITRHQSSFSHEEDAMALKIGRLVSWMRERFRSVVASSAPTDPGPHRTAEPITLAPSAARRLHS